MTTVPPELVRVSTFVRLDAATAFDLFTVETDSWWQRGPRYRFGGQERGVLAFEPGVGGRLFETFAQHTHEVGKILDWERGAKLRFEWRGTNYRPGQSTEVEVRFEPAEGGTRVTLEHRGWEALPADHPARHGLSGNDFASMIGMWWGSVMTAWREHAERR